MLVCETCDSRIAILRRFNESTSKCPKQDTLFSAKYCFNLGGQETSRHGCKMLAATQNINTNKQNQLKITKETQFCCSCVRLLVHRFTFSLLYENIRFKNVVDENILPNSWQENDLVFSSEFEKNSIINNNIKSPLSSPPPPPPPPPPPTHTHTLKISMLRVQ